MILGQIYKGIPFMEFDQSLILGPIYKGNPFINPDQN